MKLTEDSIWINEDFSNDYEEFKHKQSYVYCAQLPWVGSTEEAQQMKKQILENQEKAEKCTQLQIMAGKLQGQMLFLDEENKRLQERENYTQMLLRSRNEQIQELFKEINRLKGDTQ